jgi:hypothetical protein
MCCEHISQKTLQQPQALQQQQQRMAQLCKTAARPPAAAAAAAAVQAVRPATVLLHLQQLASSGGTLLLSGLATALAQTSWVKMTWQRPVRLPLLSWRQGPTVQLVRMRRECVTAVQ